MQNAVLLAILPFAYAYPDSREIHSHSAIYNQMLLLLRVVHHVSHLLAEQMHCAESTTELGHVPVLQTILEIHMKIADQNVQSIQIVLRIKHASEINVKIHVLALVVQMLSAKSSITYPSAFVLKVLPEIHLVLAQFTEKVSSLELWSNIFINTFM